MDKEFRKFATRHMGINSMVLDDVVSMQNQYLNPYILEERQLNVTQMDVFSRLMMDRIIFLGTEIDDYTANTLQGQRHQHLHQQPWRKRSCRLRHLRYNAVRIKRCCNNLHRYGSKHGSRVACRR